MDGFSKNFTLSNEEQKAIDKELHIQWTLWIASLAILIAILLFCGIFKDRIREQIQPTQEKVIRATTILFTCTALLIVLFSYLFKKLVFKDRIKSIVKQALEIATKNDWPVYLAKYRSAGALPIVSSSCPGICGAVLFMLGASYVILCLFIIISSLSLAYHHPKREDVLELRNRELRKKTTKDDKFRVQN